MKVKIDGVDISRLLRNFLSAPAPLDRADHTNWHRQSLPRQSMPNACTDFNPLPCSSQPNDPSWLIIHNVDDRFFSYDDIGRLQVIVPRTVFM